MGIFDLGLLIIVGVASATRAHIVYAILVEVLKRVVIAGEGDDMFVVRRCGIFLEQRCRLFGFFGPLAMIAGGIDTYVVANNDPRARTRV